MSFLHVILHVYSSGNDKTNFLLVALYLYIVPNTLQYVKKRTFIHASHYQYAILQYIWFPLYTYLILSVTILQREK